MALADLIGGKVQGKGDELVETTSFCGEGKYVGIYFSAHWCPPCRGFTPVLVEFYNTFQKTAEGKLEIVFVSSDSSKEEFDGYYADMPWLALPYDQRDTKTKLCEKFGVRGIPFFIILDSNTGEVVCAEGRSRVAGDPEGKEFPWSK